MITLTDEERVRFTTYLRELAAEDEKLADIMSRLGPMQMALAKKWRAEAMAAVVIADKLQSITIEIR